MLTARETKIISAMGNRHARRKLPYFIAEGVRVCREAVTRCPSEIVATLVHERSAGQPDVQAFCQLAQKLGVRTEIVGAAVFDSLAETENTQGVICLLNRPEYITPQALPQPFTLILDRIAEPGNFGTILRSAWAIGLTSVWLIKGGADPYAPKVVRSGMGAQFALTFAQFDSLAEAKERLLELGGSTLWCTEEKADVTIFDEQRFVMKNCGIVLGNEANGISDTTLGVPVTIPMPGNAESLNVAQAATVILFEAVRRTLF